MERAHTNLAGFSVTYKLEQTEHKFRLCYIRFASSSNNKCGLENESKRLFVYVICSFLTGPILKLVSVPPRGILQNPRVSMKSVGGKKVLEMADAFTRKSKNLPTPQLRILLCVQSEVVEVKRR